MKLNVPNLKRYQVSMFTFALLAAVFVVYYFVFVENKKEYLHERAFRSLNQDNANLNEKYRTVISNARSEISYRRSIEPGEPGYRQLHINLDSAESIRYPLKGWYNQKLEFTGISFYGQQGETASGASLRREAGKWGIHFQDTVRVLQVDDNGVHPKKVRVVSTKSRAYGQRAGKEVDEILSIAFSLVLADFVPSCLSGREEVFDGYLLWTAKEGIVYSTIPGGLHVSRPDTARSKPDPSKSHLLSTNDFQDVQIAGVPYKLFIQQVNVGQLNGLMLGGLISTRHYRAQIYQVSMFTILLSLLLMLILVLGYPFIKLRVMSPCERLHAGDAFFCAFSMVVGSFLVILIVLSGYVYAAPERVMYNRDLKNLSDQIGQGFADELDMAYRQLAQYASAALAGPTRYPGRSDILRSYGGPDGLSGLYRRIPPYFNQGSTANYTGFGRSMHPDDSLGVYPRLYPYFSHVYTIDNAGYRREMWNTDNVDKPLVQVADREFVKSVLERRTWNLARLDEPVSRPFVLEPIFNRLTGENMAVLSMPLHPASPRPAYSYRDSLRPVAAMVFKPHSVLHPVVPEGYGFCLMDQQGRVWFHSRPQKNLQEQFLMECAGDKELQAALNGNASRYFDLSYNGNQYLAYGTPIQHLPLYLVVFHREDYYKSIRTMATSMSIMYYLLALVPVAVLLLVHKGAFRYDARLRGENFAFRWLAPREDKKAQFFKLMLVFAGLIFLEGLFLVIHRNERDLWFFYVLVLVTSVAAARSLLFNDAHLTVPGKTAFWFTYGLIALLLTSKIAEEWSVLFQVGAPVIGVAIWLLMAGTLLGFFVGLHILTLKWRLRLSHLKNPPALRLVYPATLYAWVVLAGVLPALAFYKINYNREHRMAASHTLLQLARDMTQRRVEVKKQYAFLEQSGPEIPFSTQRAIEELAARRGWYLPAGYRRDEKEYAVPLPLKDHANDYKYGELIPQLRLRPLYNEIVTNNYLLLKSADALENWSWAPKDKTEELNLAYYAYNPSERRYLALTAKLPYFGPSYLLSESPRNLVLFVCGLAAILFILYSLIHYAAMHLFNFLLFEETARYLKAAQNGTNRFVLEPPAGKPANERQLVFWSGAWLPAQDIIRRNVNGFVASGKTPTLYDLSELNNEQKLIEFVNGPAEAAKGNAQARPGNRVDNHKPGNGSEKYEETPLIITHFEQLVGWAPDQEKRLQAINRLNQMIAESRQVQIFSLKDHASIRHDQMESTLSNFQEKHYHLKDFLKAETHGNPPPKAAQVPVAADGKGNKAGTRKQKRIPIFRYAGILARALWQDLTRVDREKINLAAAGNKKNRNADLVREECEQHGLFLENVKAELDKTCPSLDQATRAGLILRIQALAGVHYSVLWESCSRQEKYTLYDLALDGLVNSKNGQAITGLLEKGLLVYDGSLKLMNRSFRNYILTRVEPGEGLQIEREMAANGSWSEFRSALVLVICGIVAFIFLTQRETYNQMTAVMTALTASIPLLLKLLGNLQPDRHNQGGNRILNFKF